MTIKCCLDKELSSAVRPLANPSPICIRDRHFRWQYRVDESEVLSMQKELLTGQARLAGDEGLRRGHTLLSKARHTNNVYSPPTLHLVLVEQLRLT